MLLNEVEMRYDVRWNNVFANNVELKKIKEREEFEEDEDNEDPIMIKEGHIILHKKTGFLAKKMKKFSDEIVDEVRFRETDVVNIRLFKDRVLTLTTKSSKYLMKCDGNSIEKRYNFDS